MEPTTRFSISIACRCEKTKLYQKSKMQSLIGIIPAADWRGGASLDDLKPCHRLKVGVEASIHAAELSDSARGSVTDSDSVEDRLVGLEFTKFLREEEVGFRKVPYLLKNSRSTKAS